MVFGFYNRLSSSQRRTYRQSDHVTSVELPDSNLLAGEVARLAEALAREDRAQTQVQAQAVVSGVTTRLKVPPVRVEVLEKRPDNDWGELQGLYTPVERRAPAKITVWMRTAKRRRVVAFRTFLRTVLHEVCHHLDYELLRLHDSLHTEGFYKRESSLFHQITRHVPAGVEPAKIPE